MVYRREINGEAVLFGNQGDLWMNAMTWFDHDTGNVWSQVTGTALLGPLEGESLELLPSELSNWSDWREQFPDTLALATGTGSNTFRVRNLAVAARVNDEVASVEFGDLDEVGAISTVVGGEPLVFTTDPNLERWAVFSRVVDGVTVELEVDGAFLVDQNGTRWDRATGGSPDGAPALDRVPTFSSNFNNFIDIFPDANVLIQPEIVRDIPPPFKSYIISMD